MKPHYEDDAVTLWHGDNRTVLAALPSNSVDSCVTDPPYELGFMGRRWDSSGIAYDKYLWAEVWRVLKPGGHLLAFGGTRTWHRLACAIEDAGFEVRDSLAWMYGSGFPKSLDVSKAIDKQKANRDEVLRFTAWVREARDAAGITNADIDAAFGFAGMAGHWTSQMSQPSVPTLEQMPKLLAVLNVDQMPEEIAQLALQIIQPKGQPGDNWFRRETTGHHDKAAAGQQWNANYGMSANLEAKERRDKPATEAAAKWQGWGTALKPAFEPVVVARKPLIGTVAENVQRWGTGAINVDGCRIGTEGGTRRDGKADQPNDAGWENMRGHGIAELNAGRWPANVIFDESQAAELDRQSGVSVSRKGGERRSANAMWGRPNHSISGDQEYDDQGGASRFFYTAKADSSERPRVNGVAHPTVKPLDLMRYLVRLVTPSGGTVLEPFAGSGTTLEACIVEGFSVIGIELTEEYLPLITQRITKPIEVTLL